MPDRPVDQIDINPATVADDPVLKPLSELLAYLDLHLGRYEWKVLETTQKEMLADLVDAAHVNTAAEEGVEPWFVPRWWREDWVADEAGTMPRPDPFAGRTPPPDTYRRPDRHALSLARLAVAGEGADPFFALEEQIAVYEWALRARQPFRNADGALVAGMVVYPSLNQARTYLRAYREQTRDVSG